MHMKLGNELWEETRFNARLQPLQIGLGRTQTVLSSSLTQTNSDYLLLDYTYSSTQNNGNLLNQRIRVAAAGSAPAFDLTGQKFRAAAWRIPQTLPRLPHWHALHSANNCED